jgi:ABC-2 type transport system ATP-binding protein
VDDAPHAAAALSGAEGVLDASLFGRTLRVVCTEAGRATDLIRTRLAAVGIADRGIDQVPPSLEDVFVSRVRHAGGAIVG